jgi:cysteinyl-tRNA synthetase
MTNNETESLVADWIEAMKQQDWHYAHYLRKSMDEQGITVVLDPNKVGGTTWRRKHA